jgi:hypothetical protein
MTKLKKPVTFETAFGAYVVDELLGEGGAGRVYGGSGPDGTQVELKVLAEERPSADKRCRFNNELSFLVCNKHRNIVTVIDHDTAVVCKTVRELPILFHPNEFSVIIVLDSATVECRPSQWMASRC